MKTRLPNEIKHALWHFALLAILLLIGVLFFIFLPLVHAEPRYEASQEKGARSPQYEDRGVEYETERSVYRDHAEVDQPPEGWYQNPRDFPIPEDWPRWAVRQFQSLHEGVPEGYRDSLKWEKPPLQANTRFVDVKADRESAIRVEAPSKWRFFTYFKVEPDNVTVEQDFRGNAVIYNADDVVSYKIHCFSEDAHLGTLTTAAVGRYIKIKRRRYVHPLARIVAEEEKYYWILSSSGRHLIRIGLDSRDVYHEELSAGGYGYYELVRDRRGRGVAIALGTGCIEGESGVVRKADDPEWVACIEYEGNLHGAQSVTQQADGSGYIATARQSGTATYIAKFTESGATEAWGNGGTGGNAHILYYGAVYNGNLRLITDWKRKQYIHLRLKNWVGDNREAYTLRAIDGSGGATDGDSNWAITPYQWFKYPKDICMDNNSNHIFMVGWHTSGTMRPGNSQINIAKIDPDTGNTVWVKHEEYRTGVSLYSVKPSPNYGGMVATGTYHDGAVNKAYIMKFDEQGAVEWERIFQNPDGSNCYFRDAVEAPDGGLLAIGGYNDDDGRTWEYYVKMNRYGDTCSDGVPCN